MAGRRLIINRESDLSLAEIKALEAISAYGLKDFYAIRHTATYIAIYTSAENLENFPSINGTIGNTISNIKDLLNPLWLIEAENYKNGTAFSAKEALLAKLIEQEEVKEKIQPEELEAFLNAIWPAVEAEVTVWREVQQLKLIQQWASGDIAYAQPWLTEEKTRYLINLAGALQSLGVDKEICINASKGFLKRLETCEEKILAEETKAKNAQDKKDAKEAQARKELAREQANVERAQKASELRQAQEKLAREEAKRIEFHREFRPYSLNEDRGGLLHDIRQLSGTKKNDAERLIAIIEAAAGRLDIRDPNQHALGDFLFSDRSLLALADAFGIRESLSTKEAHQARTGFEKDAGILRQHSKACPAIIAEFLEDPEMITLLAVHMQALQNIKNYVSHLNIAYGTREIVKIQEEITGARADLDELPDDSEFQEEYKNALAKRIPALATKMADHRQKLSEAVGQVLSGADPRKTTVDISAPAKAVQDLTPDNWKKSLEGGEWFVSASDKGDKYLNIHSRQFPEIYITPKNGTSKSALENLLLELRGECEQHQANLDTIDALLKLGFTIQNNPPALIHKAFGLRVSLEGKEAEQSKALDQVREAFDEATQEQDALVESARQRGITIAENEHGLTATGSFGNISFGQYLNAQSRELLGYLHEPFQKGVIAIILDTGPLGLLSTPDDADNPDRGSLLKLIDPLSKLPKRIVVIPGLVADTECQGHVVIYNKHEEFVKSQIDPRFEGDGILGHIGHHVGIAMEPASRAQVMSDGTIMFEPGRNLGLVIIESPEDRKVDTTQLLPMFEGPAEKRVDRLQGGVYRRGMGDEAILRAVEKLQALGIECMVVTDDKGLKERLSEGAAGHASTGSFLEACIKAGWIDENAFKQIREFWGERADHPLTPDSKPTASGHTIESVITGKGKETGFAEKVRRSPDAPRWQLSL